HHCAVRRLVRTTGNLLFMLSDETSNHDSAPGSGAMPPSGVKISLANIGILLALIGVMVLVLGTVLGLGYLADKHVDKVQRRLKSQRENRDPPGAETLPDRQSAPD